MNIRPFSLTATKDGMTSGPKRNDIAVKSDTANRFFGRSDELAHARTAFEDRLASMRNDSFDEKEVLCSYSSSSDCRPEDCVGPERIISKSCWDYVCRTYA
jgi:hypothetical protein